MAERFPLTAITPAVRDIAEQLAAAGHEAWYVGGAVRDVLYTGLHGRTPARTGDFDLATSARPEDVRRLFRRTVPVGIEHGTVAVLDAEGGAHEVTTFRRDVQTDGRHAVVEFGVSLDDDLARRDFTINAIAVHPQTGDLRDPFDGRRDLAEGVVRAVGEPSARFREDRLRVLRGLRFAAAFDFRIDPATWDALCASAGELEHLSRERVRDEWVKTLATAKPSVAVGLWRRAGVLNAVWPELADLSAEAAGELDAVVPGEPVVVTAAALAHSGAAPDVALQAAQRLRFSNRDAGRIEGIVSALASPLPAPDDGRAVRRWTARHRSAAGEAAGAASDPPGGREAFREAVHATLASGVPLEVADLAVKGNDLAAAGIAPGPRMGEVLRALLEVVLDDPTLNTHEDLLARAQNLP